jgi:hypothetical protein
MRGGVRVLFSGSIIGCAFPETTEVESLTLDQAFSRVTVDLDRGSMEVVAEGELGVSAEWTSTYQRARPEVAWQEDGDELRVVATCLYDDLLCQVDFVLTVPATAILLLDTAEGEVRLVGGQNIVTVAAPKGPATVEGVSGDLTVDAAGPVEVTGAAGNRVVLDARDGGVSVTHQGPFELLRAVSETDDVVVEVPAGSYQVVVNNPPGGVVLDSITEDPTATSEIEAQSLGGRVAIYGR